MINIDINTNGYASGDAWSRVVCDPNVPDTYTMHTDYPDKYTRDKYKIQYVFKDSDFTTDRLEIDQNGDIIIPSGFVDPNNRLYCKFIITRIAGEIDVVTSSFELILTLQSSSYLNPDADKFIVVPTRKSMYRLPSDCLANGKIIKVVYDDTNEQQSVFYYWDAIIKSFVKDPKLNRSGGGSETTEARIVYSEEEMLSLESALPGAIIYRADIDTVLILQSLPAYSKENWRSTSFDILSLPNAELVEGTDYLLIGSVSDGVQRKITVDQLEAAIGNWKTIS